ncbi:DUF4268 domain-containing protein [Symmachiella dynata]|uniref:DUF4268 domain-containing protein n=1 Tax=Symmachiella dynata TaxID=2527995 RepID=UPI0030EDB3FB
MTTSNLGRLEKVELRNIWTTEAGDFTPWLAGEANIALLGDTIGIELEVEAQEKEVGPFRADILCKDTANDRWVLIENQLERTDHTHLGQLMTYAAGLNAVTIVWIAARFTDEHRAAIDWLNDITNDDFNFFGLEVELWRIGDSAVAPKFNLTSSPNDWTKQVAQGAQRAALTPAKTNQLEFWADFCDYVAEHGSALKTVKPSPQNWLNISIGRSGIRLNAIASYWDSVMESTKNHEIRAELELYDNFSKGYYVQLLGAKDMIEKELGEPLTWYNPDDKKVCRIYLRQVVDLDDRERWPEYHEWLRNKLEALRGVFSQRVKQLEAGFSSDDGEEVNP